ncbi:hypothetical protein GA0070558_102278 [Micromonospora haikouensis]|uniref:Uncharacterized protein n=1 Tax=Micromonospora haikouensis TaxID=686309 RepID=A0A1C4U893_9ACTN|nr:hypothetical protein [Micromonospora haikouensis]SCE67886.1 hypothetical protein GA0070558_102278 [Micromonospora haikouensis]
MREGSNRSRWTRRTTAVGGAALSALVLGQLALTGPVAAVPGLSIRTTTGPSNSVAKSQSATCPTGTTVIGGGGAITGSGLGQVGMDIMLPLAGGSAYSVTGREDENGVAGNWAVTASTLCAPAPSGLVTVSGSSAPSFGTSNWFEKSCPAGKHAIGVGGAVVGASNSEVILEDLRIQQNSVVVAGVEDGTGFAGSWWLDATAICADPLPGEQRVVDDSSYSSAAVQSVVATCPAGTRVHGVGGEILGGEGQVRLTEMRATSSTAVTVRAMEDENGFSSNWKVRAYAVCAN